MKRSGFKPRTTTLRATPPAKAELRILPKRKCANCRESFRPFSSMETWCSHDCAAILGLTKVEKAKRKTARELERLAREEKKSDRAAKEAMKRLPDLKAEAQEAFNRYVRLRDAGKGCFVCGVTLTLGGVGGGFDAGHIRSRSNADNLRYDERNVHGQCKPCNAVGATKDWEMRAAADRLLGPETAAALYADNAPIKWQRDKVRAIRDEYRRRAKTLEKEAKT